MPYRLTADESVTVGLTRVLSEETDSAITELLDITNPDKGIHEARKSIKKIRAVIRLSEPWLGRPGEGVDLQLRDAGRALSEYRDAAAMLETVDALKERFRDEASVKSLARVHRALARRGASTNEEKSRQAAIRRTIAALRHVVREIEDRPKLPNDFSAIQEGFRKTYRRGGRSLRLCQVSPTAVNSHELRKSIKGHWYHVRLLENLWPATMEVREKCLADLQEWLGDDHNLAVLKEKPEADKILSPIETCQQELRGASLALAEKIYAERSRDHMRRMRRLWELWRGQGSSA
ncbi:MAG: CHAD domain-containing protein [Terriglobia bacterium]